MNKHEWHQVYKEYVFEHYNYQCSNCFKVLEIYDGVVHHKTYKHKGGIYSASAKELIDCRKITVLCHECHEIEHQTKSIDRITKLLDVRCLECGWETPQSDLTNGKCEICYNIELQNKSEYEW
jgi:hypothetical protein